MARTFPDETAARLAALCALQLRQPSGYATDDATGSPILDFDPPLTSAEQTTFDDLVLLARSGLDIGLVKFRTIKADVGTIRSYDNLTSPTAAQRLAYEKALGRVMLVALLRD